MVNGEQQLRLPPTPAIAGSHQHRMARRQVFRDRIAQVVEVELTIPVGERRGMIVGPPVAVGEFTLGAIRPHHLNALHADRRSKSPVVHREIDAGTLHAHRFIRATWLGPERRDDEP